MGRLGSYCQYLALAKVGKSTIISCKHPKNPSAMKISCKYSEKECPYVTI